MDLGMDKQKLLRYEKIKDLPKCFSNITFL
jgi:hypothetical protein